MNRKDYWDLSIADAAADPAKAVEFLFEQTDESGTLRIRDVDPDGREQHQDCILCWTKADAHKLTEEYRALYEALKTIAENWENAGYDARIGDLPEAFSENERNVWDTYIRSFDAGDFDLERIRDIEDQIELEDGSVSEENAAYYDAYRKAYAEDAAGRIGGREPETVIVRAKRLCRLLSLGAPDIIVRIEASHLALAMVCNRYGR